MAIKYYALQFTLCYNNHRKYKLVKDNEKNIIRVGSSVSLQSLSDIIMMKMFLNLQLLLIIEYDDKIER